MRIQFSYNKSDERQIFKELVEGTTMEGALRNESSLVDPIIRVEDSSVFRYNYCYIPEWQRYYYVGDIKTIRTDLYEVYLHTDVLMSFKGDIYYFQVVIDKQTEEANSDEYIDDGSLVTNSLMFNRVYKFSNGFNNTPEYVLITVG